MFLSHSQLLPPPPRPGGLLCTPCGLRDQTGLKPTEGSEGRAWQLTSHPEQGGVRGHWRRWGGADHQLPGPGGGLQRHPQVGFQPDQSCRERGPEVLALKPTLVPSPRPPGKHLSHLAPTARRAHPVPARLLPGLGPCPPPHPGAAADSPPPPLSPLYFRRRITCDNFFFFFLATNGLLK